MALIYLAVLVPAVADWVAVARDDRRLERIFKPATLVVLMVVAGVTWEGAYDGRFAATMAALAFSLAGDVFLMQDRDLLLQGLGSFLVAHVFYIAAFGGPVLSPYSVFLAVSLIMFTGALFLLIRQGLRRSERHKLIAPVAIYAVVLSIMVLTALTAPGANGWGRGAITWAAVGALLFYISDGLIGIQRFVRETRRGPLAIIITYHLAQIALVYALATA